MSDSEIRSAVEMQPIASWNQYVKIKTYKADIFRQITFWERIPWFQAADIGAIAAGITSPKTAITNLDLWDEEFGQWRYYPLDNVQVRFFLPAGVSKYQLKTITTGIDKSIVNRDPLLASTEFYTWEDQRPSVECLNFSDYALLASRIMVCGIRFHTVAPPDNIANLLKNDKMTYTTIPCAGSAGGGD